MPPLTVAANMLKITNTEGICMLQFSSMPPYLLFVLICSLCFKYQQKQMTTGNKRRYDDDDDDGRVGICELTSPRDD